MYFIKIMVLLHVIYKIYTDFRVTLKLSVVLLVRNSLLDIFLKVDLIPSYLIILRNIEVSERIWYVYYNHKINYFINYFTNKLNSFLNNHNKPLNFFEFRCTP